MQQKQTQLILYPQYVLSKKKKRKKKAQKNSIKGKFRKIPKYGLFIRLFTHFQVFFILCIIESRTVCANLHKYHNRAKHWASSSFTLLAPLGAQGITMASDKGYSQGRMSCIILLTSYSKRLQRQTNVTIRGRDSVIHSRSTELSNQMSLSCQERFDPAPNPISA